MKPALLAVLIVILFIPYASGQWRPVDQWQEGPALSVSEVIAAWMDLGYKVEIEIKTEPPIFRPGEMVGPDYRLFAVTLSLRGETFTVGYGKTLEIAVLKIVRQQAFLLSIIPIPPEGVRATELSRR